MSTYAWVALIPTAISIGLGVYCRYHRDRPGAGALFAMMVSLTLWSGGYALELMPSGLPWKIFAAKIQYLGIATVPVIWFLLALAYTHSLGGLSRRAMAGLFAIPSITVVLAWTNEVHGWIWADSGLYQNGELSVAVFAYGPWFAVNVTYGYALMFLASALFLRTLMMLPNFNRQSLGLVMSAIAPWMANLAHVTALSPTYPLDLTPFAFVLGGLGIAVSLRRFRFLDLAPVARTTIVDRLRDAVIVVDTRGRVIDLNPAGHLVIGVRRGAVIGAPVRELFGDVPALVEAAHSDAETTGEILIGEGAEERRYGMYVAPIHESGGAVCGRLITLHDITELRDAEARVQYLAYRDPLTGLPNRQLFRDRFEQALSVAKRSGSHVACLFLDLDDFKKVNDHYGHSIGDELLREASARITRALREVDTVARVPATEAADHLEVAPDEVEVERPTLARFGGDEFVVLLQGLKRADEAITAAERVVEALRRPFQLGQSMISVRTSIGIAVAPDDGSTVEVLLRNADAAMYAAKNRGGDSIRFFTRAINEQARMRVEIESGLHRALEDDELSLEYQPSFDAATGAIVSVEALVRWDHPMKGRIAPAEFLPVVEESGLSAELGRWVVRQASREWQELRAHLPEARLSLNLAARQLVQPGFVDELLETMRDERLPGSELELELTEGALMEDPDRSLEVLGRLREQGVRFAIDDFGTGLFSLSHIRSLALDMVKIDRSFVTQVDDPTFAALVRAIIALAHELGIVASAEGVETREQLDFLREEGCDRVQGYLFAEPLSLDAALQRLQRSRGWGFPLRATA